MNYIKIVIMTYFTKNIFKNILSYCDDRLEVKQRKHKTNLLADLALLQEDQLSTIIGYKQELIGLDYNEYVIHWNEKDNIFDLLDLSRYHEDYESDYDNELTEDFLDVSIIW